MGNATAQITTWRSVSGMAAIVASARVIQIVMQDIAIKNVARRDIRVWIPNTKTRKKVGCVMLVTPRRLATDSVTWMETTTQKLATGTTATVAPTLVKITQAICSTVIQIRIFAKIHIPNTGANRRVP